MNEPAFPATIYPSAQAKAVERAADTHWPGMTLRDYFAAGAMQAYCSDSEWRADMDSAATARGAYAMADAMLKARQE